MTINSTSPRSALATPYSSAYNTSMFHHKHAILLAGSNSLSIAQPRTDGTASCFIIQMTQRAKQALHYPTLNSALTTGSRLDHERDTWKKTKPSKGGQLTGFGSQHATRPTTGVSWRVLPTAARGISNVFIAYLRNTLCIKTAHTDILYISSAISLSSQLN